MDSAWIKEKIIGIDYGFNAATFLTVLVPGFSSFVRRTQTAFLVNSLKAKYRHPEQTPQLFKSKEYLKLGEVLHLHKIGFLIQTLAFAILSLFRPLFLPLAVFTAYEAFNSPSMKRTKIQIISGEGLYIVLQ